MGAKSVNEVTKQSWLSEIFPEWGTWLNEEIDRTEVPAGSFEMWWTGNMGVWIKSEGQTNIAVDLWAGSGKRTHDLKPMGPRHQFARAAGARAPQPNLRVIPVVIDPFEIHTLDALFVTHFHHDHIDINVIAALLQGCGPDTIFVGPKFVVDQWVAWGVPAERCRTVRPGDVVKVKDIEVTVVESYDRTVLITDSPIEETPADDEVPDMDERSVSYLIKTPAGTIYHGGDSHFSANFSRHGKQFDIDVAMLAYGENPVSIQDKMSSSDVLRAAEALGCKVVIPLHWDVWSNTLGDPAEIQRLWDMRHERFQYGFHPFSWLPGGRFIWPDDEPRREYFHDRGFADHHEYPSNMPYDWLL
jgi:L-ascorbate 6-phosphate lactonase